MIGRIWSSLIGLALAVAICPALAAEVVIQDENDHYPLNDQLVYSVDPTGQTTLQELVEQGEWLEKSERVLNLGFTSAPVWVKASIRIPEATDEQWYVVIPYSLLEEAKLHVLQDGRLPAIHQITREQVLESPKHSDGYSVSLPFPEGLSGKFDLILRADSSTSLQVPLEFWREDYLIDRYSEQSFYWGG